MLVDAIKEANIDIKHLSAVELVGDGTRIPIIIRSIKKAFGIDPSRTMHYGII